MSRAVRSLQAALEEQFADLPRLIATQVVREKLAAQGHADREDVVAIIVERLLSNDAGGGTGDKDDIIDLEGNEEISLSFDEGDTDRISKIIEDIVENLPDLIHKMAKKASAAMLRRYERDWAKWWPDATAQLDQFRNNLENRWGEGTESPPDADRAFMRHRHCLPSTCGAKRIVSQETP